MKEFARRQYSADNSTHVVNRSGFWGVGDLIQCVGNELGAIDITAIRGAEALRKAGTTSGMINVVAHSQGSMTFRRALDLVDEPSVRGRIAYQGFGPQIYNSGNYLGLQSVQNFWNQEASSAFRRDVVPLANYIPTPANLMGDPFMLGGYAEWQRVDSPGNQEIPNGNRHGFQNYYRGYAY